MTSTISSPLLRRFLLKTKYQFWIFQFIGWAGLSIISFFSLNLWYNQPELSYIGHNLVQSILGILISWPLRYVFQQLWNHTPYKRLFLAFIAVAVASLIWSVLRLVLFMAMTGEQGLLGDFGGWFFASIFIFLCWSALYHGFKYYNLLQVEHAQLLAIEADNKQAQLKRIQAESVAREAQLKMLRYQLNPHFLFNTLNAIASLIQSKSTDKANKMVVQLSEFLRYSLDNNPIQMVPLSTEIDALNLYLKIEQTRFGSRLEVDFDIKPDAGLIEIPSLLLQPLVENAIKYAIAPSEEGGRIKINARIEQQLLFIEVADSGSLVPSVQADSIGFGVGLKNTTERLDNFYNGCYEFDVIANEPKGTSIKMQLPISIEPRKE